MLLHFDIPSGLEDLLESTPDVMPGRLPVMDIAENDNETLVVAEIPGVQKQDLRVTLDKDILTIEAERKSQEIPDSSRVLLNERRVRSFVRTLRVSHPVDRDAISASLENGILRVVLPKSATSRPRTIEVR